MKKENFKDMQENVANQPGIYRAKGFIVPTNGYYNAATTDIVRVQPKNHHVA